jgi:sulfatase modifying factor 1
MRRLHLNWITLSTIAVLAATVNAASPVVSNVQVSQRSGTKLVDITYDLALSGGGTCYVRVEISTDGGVRWRAPASTFTGDVEGGVSPGNGKSITWNAGADFDGNFADNCKARVTAYDETYPIPPAGMVYIPAGIFQMGDNLDSDSNAPIIFVQVSDFFMSQFEMTLDEYQTIYSWANSHGYDINAHDSHGTISAQGANHPIQTVSWEDALKLANAKSEREGLTPCYYSNVSHTTVLRSGDAPYQSGSYVKWDADGYRLPTEAEWEKAARGGITGKRFPWGTDTINHSYANYEAFDYIEYDIEPSANASGVYHPQSVSGDPRTMPVGSFSPNGYGLYDMSGNVKEWCWDVYKSDFYGSSLVDPICDAGSTQTRVVRGGTWDDRATVLRSCNRSNFDLWNGTYGYYSTSSDLGLRLVRRPSE